jgi:hypothetical protein
VGGLPWTLYSGSGGSVGAGNFGIGKAEVGPLVLVVSADDQVGILTTDPQTELHVSRPAAGTAEIRVDAPNGSDSRVSLFERVGGSLGGQIFYNASLNTMNIGTVASANTFTPAISIDRGSSNVGVAGTLTAASKSFRIDHPLDPANKELWHTSVESPDMKTIYDGNVTTDQNGFAEVVLPDWFESLNTNFRYQITIISEDAPDFAVARVARRIANNRFMVKTVPGNLEVSWQVTGIRHDAYAKLHRTPVEVNKPAHLRGRYLTPEAHGVADNHRMPAPEGAAAAGVPEEVPATTAAAAKR